MNFASPQVQKTTGTRGKTTGRKSTKTVRGNDGAYVAAVKEERFYILTHPAIKAAIGARMEDILGERTPRDPMRL